MKRENAAKGIQVGVQDDYKKSARGLYAVRLLQLGRKSAVRGLNTGTTGGLQENLSPKQQKRVPMCHMWPEKEKNLKNWQIREVKCQSNK